MKHLKQHTFNKVKGGTKDSECDSFKKDIKEALETLADDVGHGANSLAVKINELLEKYK